MEFASLASNIVDPGAMTLRTALLRHQKIRAYRYLYEFTKSQCSDCAKTDCACKDTICAHVEAQIRGNGLHVPTTGARLRFLGCDGCVVPPHLRETCTIYLCEPAQNRADFPAEKYRRLKEICFRIEEKLMASPPPWTEGLGPGRTP